MLRLSRSIIVWSICGLLLMSIGSSLTYAQSSPATITMTPPHPASKMSQRYEIDAKRTGVNMNSEDALPRSREFKRVDSSYYVGWMLEGGYKYFHAADYLGYKNASIPLERALSLCERDYKKQLATRTSSILEYFPVYKFQMDYTQIAAFLMNCYNNTEQPDKTFALLQRVAKWNFQREYYLDIYNYMAWTVHRNRFYTSAKYSFLKNNINDNEQLANYYLNKGLKKIEKDKVVNAHIFQPGYEQSDKLAVYHYKSIIHSYALRIDSAAYYYNELRKANTFPHNNYATFRSICGDFREAEGEYQKASQQDAGDKRLQEWAYYSSIIDIYKGQPKEGASLMKDMIKAAGSTPGFGWYNIALSRTMLYDGQIAEAKRHIDKAAEFKELHIGTTLGQSHYDFSIQLLKLMNKEYEWQMQWFEHRNWWYNPSVLPKMAQLVAERYSLELLIINQFAQNPERDKVIYKLFSTESTVSWDEIWYLIRDFSTGYFLQRFQQQATTDDRAYIRKYFKFFAARLMMKQGHYTAARQLLDEVLRDANKDPEYERLFLARVMQAQADCSDELKQPTTAAEWRYRMYQLYPQLLPFTQAVFTMQLHTSGSVDEAVISRLKACNIRWATDNTLPAPHAYVSFSNSGTKKSITYYVQDKTGKFIVPSQSFSYLKPDEAGVALAYRLFNIGDEPPATPASKPKK